MVLLCILCCCLAILALKKWLKNLLDSILAPFKAIGEIFSGGGIIGDISNVGGVF